MKILAKPTTINVFIADDGTEFTDLYRCMSYEFGRSIGLGASKEDLTDCAGVPVLGTQTLFVIKHKDYPNEMIVKYVGGRYFDVVSANQTFLFNPRLSADGVEHIYKLSRGDEIKLSTESPR